MTELLSKSKRQYLKQLIIGCQLRRFTPAESLVYIRDKLGVAVSERHYYTIKKQVLQEFFRRNELLSGQQKCIFISLLWTN